MFLRLLITLAQVKAGNISANLVNEIRQTIFSLYQAKEITKQVYNNIMKSIKLLTNSANTKFCPFQVKINCSKFITDGF